jgi:hypothetical protein
MPVARALDLWHYFARQNYMPQPESFAKGACQHCGGHIEFPIRAAGQNICCPHCDKPTLLSLNQTARKRTYLPFAIAAGALAAACGAYFYFSPKGAQHVAATSIQPVQTTNASPVQPSNAGPVIPAPAPVPPPKPEPPPDPWHQFKPGAVALEKTGDGRLVYAVGTLTNATTRQRFGVKVELDVLDEQRNKIGSATDYTDVIEPGKVWKFRAMVTDKTAAAAKLTKVKEQE